MNRTPLEVEIRRHIEVAGPMPVRQFMRLCLTHPDYGYYMTRDPLGRAGDFVTSPEISQVFGELIGLWAASVWHLMGQPENIRLVELGPGRGSMMADALRAAEVVPAFRQAIVLHLVEASPVLQERQQQTLGSLNVPLLWHTALDEVPEGPAIILANEFLDALPVNQAIKQINGWYERVVEVDAEDNLQFGIASDLIPLFEGMVPAELHDAPIGTIYEWRSDNLPLAVGQRLVRQGGAALLIDYGHTASAGGETLQAVAGHDFVNPLERPGMVDLTAHVDFQAFATAAETMGARIHGPVEQGRFLKSLGVDKRATALTASAPRDKAHEIHAAIRRLCGEERGEMGRLFKVIAIADPKLGALPGLETIPS
jgi:SAM-dependent MidA family methyltransferase